MAKAYFHWKEPRAVVAWWKTTQKRLLKDAKFLRYMFWPIVFLVVANAWSLFVNGLPTWKDNWFLLAFLGAYWLLHRVPKSYTIAPRGLRLENGMSRVWYRWNDIEYYQIAKNDFIAPGIFCLSFKLRRRSGFEWPMFYFDTKEVDEQKLRDVLELHLPDKEQKAFSSPSPIA